MTARNVWRWPHTVTLLLILCVLIAISWYSPPESKPLVYLAAVLLLGLFTATAGHGVTGLWRGLAIDSRNKVSLSQVQMLLWTFVVVGGLLVAALANLALDAADPLEIAIPEEVWALLGISAASLVASPLIKVNKQNKELDPRTEALAYDRAQREGVDPAKMDNQGTILRNRTPAEASWADLFRGEELGNAGQLDLAKVQMFFFTVILVALYALSLGAELATDEPVSSFPELSEGMVALLAISHAGYWTHKAVPHTTT